MRHFSALYRSLPDGPDCGFYLVLISRNIRRPLVNGLFPAIVSDNPEPSAYIGFEPSGLVHLGWVLVASKIKDLADAGLKTTVLWADWHAYINDKLGGDLENIRKCARYMEDCFEALGVPRDKVNYVYASELLNDIKYWETVIKVAKVTSLSRV